MKVSLTIAMVMLACVATFGQNGSPEQPGPESAAPQATQPEGARPMCRMAKRRGPGPHMRMQMRMCMKEHLRQMRAEVREMQAGIAKMRADANAVQSVAVRTALLDDVDMWTHVVSLMQDHLREMHGMMKGGGMGMGMGNGMMPGKDMRHCRCKRRGRSCEKPNGGMAPPQPAPQQ